MRRIFSFAATLVIGITLVAGCSDDPASGNDSKGTMSAKVSGTSWSASQITQATYANGVLGIGGTKIDGANSKQIVITGMVSGTGDYQIGGILGLQGSYSDGSAASVKIFSGTSGTMKVEEISATGAKGTFSFEALEQTQGGPGTETRSITEGKFDVKF